MPVYARWKVLTVDRWSRRSGNVSISFQDCLIASSPSDASAIHCARISGTAPLSFESCNDWKASK
jgi:hypothetical protein